MYPYIKFADETEVTHSHIIERNGNDEIEVHFERPHTNGFDSARCVLPFYEWIMQEGYDAFEIETFERFLRSNAHLIYRYAACGGIKIA